MTENERQEILKDIRDGYIDGWDNLTIDELFKTIEKEHNEIQQYRAIGTVEECRTAVEKMKPKKPVDRITFKECSVCGNVEIEYCRHCSNCGQLIDWSDTSETPT